jgi:hypothetical protein
MPFPPPRLDAGVYSVGLALQADQVGIAAALRALDERVRRADRRQRALVAGQLVETKAESAQQVEIFERVGAAARQPVGPELGHQDAVAACAEHAARAAHYLRFGALHVDLDEPDRSDAVLAADIVERVRADRLLAVKQPVGIKRLSPLLSGFW